ncbi:MAG: 3'-5' exonuclease [Candidatus Methanoperedens sp.]|nr:3'-5' exonuclease [Candidatus Methanoperedens sp.]
MFLIFDTETTGEPKNWKSPVSDLANWPRMVQIAWLQYDISGKQIAERNYIVKPNGFTIPEDTVKIHGISTEQAINEGVELKTALIDFSNAINESSYLVAHNMSFDANVIGAEFLRENVENKLFETPQICTMESSTNFCKLQNRYGYKWPSLSELHLKLFKKGFDEAHNAAFDVKVCADCFFELKRKGVLKL